MTNTRLGVPLSIPINQLHEYPGNPRKGNIPAIKESLTANGQFAPLVVNKHNGALTVLSGNHTLQALKQLQAEHPDGGWGTVDCYVVEVDEQHARKIMLAANRTSDLAVYDDTALLAELEALDVFDGTGWDVSDLQELQELVDETSLDTLDVPDEFPYPGMATVTLQLLPPLYKQWKNFTQRFDSPEEALEHLLDHGREA